MIRAISSGAGGDVRGVTRLMYRKAATLGGGSKGEGNGGEG